MMANLPLRMYQGTKRTHLGTKQVVYSGAIYLEQQDVQAFELNEEITLMNWGNAIVRHIVQNPETNLVSHLDLELHLVGDVKKTNKKLTWLSKHGRNLVPVELVEFSHIITKDKLEKEDDVGSHINWDSKATSHAWADCNVASLVTDDIIQFERKGYYRVDQAYKEGEPAVLFSIPTGKTS
jgi:glutamyl-tRNA synthetase